MLTAAERNALILTVTFLLLGAGAKAWVRAKTELGPFDGPAAAPAAASAMARTEPEDTTERTMADSTVADSKVAPPKTAEEKATRSTATATAAAKATAARKAIPVGKVDVNRAGEEELSGIPGIGPKTARALIEARRARGGFKKLEDLLEVKGIGERKLERMAPHLRLPSGEAAQGPDAGAHVSP